MINYIKSSIKIYFYNALMTVFSLPKNLKFFLKSFSNIWNYKFPEKGVVEMVDDNLKCLKETKHYKSLYKGARITLIFGSLNLVRYNFGYMEYTISLLSLSLLFFSISFFTFWYLYIKTLILILRLKKPFLSKVYIIVKESLSLTLIMSLIFFVFAILMLFYNIVGLKLETLIYCFIVGEISFSDIFYIISKKLKI